MHLLVYVTRTHAASNILATTECFLEKPVTGEKKKTRKQNE